MVTNNTFANTFPADAANPFQQYVGEPAALRTPAEDWRRVTTQMQPFWQTRVPMSGLGDRLRARYMLSAPAMAETPGMQPTFSQYLGDYIQDPTSLASPRDPASATGTCLCVPGWSYTALDLPFEF